MSVLWVGCGGFLGAIARYGTYQLVRAVVLTEFPLATLLVNVLGCLAAGALASLIERHPSLPQHQIQLWSIGFLGAYTTFSTFGVETFSLVRSGQIEWLILSISLQLLLGIGGVWLGYTSVAKIF